MPGVLESALPRSGRPHLGTNRHSAKLRRPHRPAYRTARGHPGQHLEPRWAPSVTVAEDGRERVRNLENPRKKQEKTGLPGNPRCCPKRLCSNALRRFVLTARHAGGHWFKSSSAHLVVIADINAAQTSIRVSGGGRCDRS